MTTGKLYRNTTIISSTPEAAVRSRSPLSRTIMYVAVVITFILAGLFPNSPLIVEPAAQHPDFNVLRGPWIRTDGGYRLTVREITPDGQVQVQYFNPRPIKVARADVAVRKGLVKLFFELKDDGYPGSTYTLYYFAQKDALAGFYYQAVQGQQYEVIFVRQK